jgi:hypothetical protein
MLEKIIFTAVRDSFVKRLADMGQLPPSNVSKMIKLSSKDNLPPRR